MQKNNLVPVLKQAFINMIKHSPLFILWLLANFSVDGAWLRLIAVVCFWITLVQVTKE